jgi:hypothetical protein
MGEKIKDMSLRKDQVVYSLSRETSSGNPPKPSCLGITQVEDEQ